MEKKLERSKSEKVFGGVCGGLAEYFDLDVTLIRIIFVLSALFSGGGLIIYIVLAFLMPEEASTAESAIGAELG